MYPISLSDLAMERFGKFLSDMTRRLVKMVQCSPLDNSIVQYIKENCKCLEEIVYKTVPPNLANEICAKFQTYVLRTYLIDSGYFSPFYLHDQTLEDEFYCKAWMEAALEVLLAILHPKVTRFSFVCKTILDEDLPTFTVPYLSRVMEKLKCIKEMKLDVEPIDRGTFLYYLLKHTELEELTFVGCNDTTIKLCNDFGMQFTKLDVRDSNISDSCIPYLLKFENLRYLDIMHSYVSEEGVTELLKGLSKNNEDVEGNSLCKRNSLNTFKSDLSSYQVYHIGNYFPKLTCLDVCLHRPLNLLPLKNLKNLTNLTVGVHGYSNSIVFHALLGDLLREIGNQLLELNVIKVDDIDLQFIAQNCPSLEILGLKSVNRSQVRISQNDTILPSIQYCELSTCFRNDDYVKFVFSCLSNVKVLKLTMNRHEYSHPLFDDILERLRSGKLRALLMDDYKIILRCSSLVVTVDNNYLAFITRDINFREVLGVLQRNDTMEMPRSQE